METYGPGFWEMRRCKAHALSFCRHPSAGHDHWLGSDRTLGHRLSASRHPRLKPREQIEDIKEAARRSPCAGAGNRRLYADLDFCVFSAALAPSPRHFGVTISPILQHRCCLPCSLPFRLSKAAAFLPFILVRSFPFWLFGGDSTNLPLFVFRSVCSLCATCSRDNTFATRTIKHKQTTHKKEILFQRATKDSIPHGQITRSSPPFHLFSFSPQQVCLSQRRSSVLFTVLSFIPSSL